MFDTINQDRRLACNQALIQGNVQTYGQNVPYNSLRSFAQLQKGGYRKLDLEAHAEIYKYYQCEIFLVHTTGLFVMIWQIQEIFSRGRGQNFLRICPIFPWQSNTFMVKNKNIKIWWGGWRGIPFTPLPPPPTATGKHLTFLHQLVHYNIACK